MARPTSHDRRLVGGRRLGVAIASGLLLAGLLLWTLYSSPGAFTGLVAALVALGVVEAGTVLTRSGWPTATPVLLLVTGVATGGALRWGSAGTAAAAAVLLGGTALWVLWERRDVLRAAAATLLLGVWVPVCASFAVLLATRPEDAPAAVLAAVGGAALNDIGAFAVGVAWGRRPLVPHISPNKTWEGFLGGLVTATIAGAVVLPLLSTRFDAGAGAAAGAVAALAAVLGDLFESRLKRALGVKDLGALIPGHGGVLDRVDGILFALPATYYTLGAVLR